jgi:serine/threonine protein kinase
LCSRYGSLTGYKINEYIITGKLGQGSFGSVFCCFNDITKQLFAAKVIDLQNI